MGRGGTAPQLRIAVFDDSGEIRDGLRRRFARDPRVNAVACAAASDVDAVVRVVEDFRPNVVLIDPGGGGIETPAMRTLRRDGECLIAMHVAHADEDGRRLASAAGCDLYILKGMRTTDLVDLLVKHSSRTTLDEPGLERLS